MRSFQTDKSLRDFPHVMACANAAMCGSKLFDRHLLRLIFDFTLFNADEHYLENAAHSGNLTVVKYLVENGDHPNKRRNKRALENAAFGGHLEVVRFLIASGADVHASSDMALRYACERGHFEIVRALVEGGADVEASSNCPLRLAFFFGRFSIARYLIENGAEFRDYIFLKNACQSGSLEIIKYLENLGVDIEENGDAMLLDACTSGQSEVVLYLLERGVSSEAAAIALGIARREGYLDIVKLLEN